MFLGSHEKSVGLYNQEPVSRPLSTLERCKFREWDTSQGNKSANSIWENGGRLLNWIFWGPAIWWWQGGLITRGPRPEFTSLFSPLGKREWVGIALILMSGLWVARTKGDGRHVYCSLDRAPLQKSTILELRLKCCDCPICIFQKVSFQSGETKKCHWEKWVWQKVVSSRVNNGLSSSPFFGRDRV